jgi:hypothetical protein
MRSLFIILFLLFTPVAFSSAQIGTSLVSGQLQITLDPAYPSPNSEVTASLDNYSVSNRISNLSWRLNGETIKELDNQRSIKFDSGEAGKSVTVEVVADLVGGGKMTAKKTLTPAYLDIIIEPQTRVPSFYLGRALPSMGSTINLTAMVNGNSTKPSDLVYLWSIDNKVLDGGSSRGKNKISAITPSGKVFLVSLTVSKLSGEVVVRKNIQIQTATPEIVFYENNTLYGLSHKPFSSSLNIIGSSATFRAEPYYLDLLTYNNPSLLEWEIDGEKVPNNSKNPYEITLAGQGDGSSQVNFHVRNLAKLLQGAKGEIQVNF